MGKITHDISSPNDGLGDVLRQAFENQNAMNTELYDSTVKKVTGKGLSDVNYSSADKAKLDSIALNAQVNVQADWLQEDDTQDNFIKNKPSIEKFPKTQFIANGITATYDIGVLSNITAVFWNGALLNDSDWSQIGSEFTLSFIPELNEIIKPI
jgi:hypothetical protein